MAKEKTWRALREIAESDGLDAESVERLRRLTAPARHEARIAATLAAVIEYVAIPSAPRPMGATVQSLRDWADAELLAGRSSARHALACLELDRRGVGGHGGEGGEGGSTARMTWARGLGKGRRQATDGAAYMAALDEAIETLSAALFPRIVAEGAGVETLASPEDLSILGAHCIAAADAAWLDAEVERRIGALLRCYVAADAADAADRAEIATEIAAWRAARVDWAAPPLAVAS